MDLTDRSLTSSSCLTVSLRFLVFGRKKKFYATTRISNKLNASELNN